MHSVPSHIESATLRQRGRKHRRQSRLEKIRNGPAHAAGSVIHEMDTRSPGHIANGSNKMIARKACTVQQLNRTIQVIEIYSLFFSTGLMLR